jgi:carboxypeptidase Q
MLARCAALGAALALALCVGLHSQESIDLAAIDRIKGEAFGHSAVTDDLRALVDQHGGRLTGSPQFEAAARWAIDRLTRYGISNAHVERWGPFGRSWALEQHSVEMLSPQYARLTAVPLAWSGATAGPVATDVILAPFELSFARGPRRLAEDFAAYRVKWKGKLRGKIVLFTPAQATPPRDKPLFERHTDATLAALANAPEPFALQRVKTLDEIEWPEKEEEAMKLFRAMPDAIVDQLFDRFDALTAERARFLSEEGVAAVLLADRRAREGLLAAEAAGSFHARDPLPPPMFVVTAEHYNRMVRLVEAKQPLRVRVDLKAAVSSSDVDGGNVIGEIAGGSRKDEIVLVGAHFDSWHSATGTTANAAGSAVMIEVMRILKAANLKLDRTIRLALWGGEEQGLLGSKAYVKAHFADPATMKPGAEHAKLSGYFNLDNGSGRIRGVYLQSHEAMRPLFEQWLAPFRDLGVTTITIRDTGGTDHLAFTQVGLPAFQFVQDDLDYGTVTHHSSADTFEHAVSADLMQASAVIASVVYHAANRPERLPRRPLPPPEPAK